MKIWKISALVRKEGAIGAVYKRTFWMESPTKPDRKDVIEFIRRKEFEVHVVDTIVEF